MRKTYGSDTTTLGIRVKVEPFYLPEESLPGKGKHVFGYRIAIQNGSAATVQLLSRHWIIIDGDGERQDVEGPGVVGHTPILESGECFEYASYCPLPTSWGTMEGSFQMRRSDGSIFAARVGRFMFTTDAAVLAPQEQV